MSKFRPDLADLDAVVAAAVDTALLVRDLSDAGDHAVQVGRRVVFMVSGMLPAEDEISTYWQRVSSLSVLETETVPRNQPECTGPGASPSPM